MSTALDRRSAIALLSMDEKTFDNYFKNADEFNCLPRNAGGRFKFNKDDLKKWKASYDWRTVVLTKVDYNLCLDFALAMHFRGYVPSDWGTGRQREFGQKITNWVKGQLGEVAFQRFIKREFGLELELDFEVRPEIVPQDIIGITDRGTSRTPKLGVGIKSSKPKSSYLILSNKEATLPARRSDIYVFCRPDIPDDHLLRAARDNFIELVKDQPHYTKYSGEIPHFSDIKCEIAGWCFCSDLEEVTSIPGQNFDNLRLVKKSGQLRKSREDWEELVSLL